VFGIGWHLIAILSILYAHLDPYIIVAAEGTLVGTITTHYFVRKQAEDLISKTFAA
jgi:hypothetical protein